MAVDSLDYAERSAERPLVAETRALVGESFLHCGSWGEAARVLHPLADDEFDDSCAKGRATAQRVLGNLYARRGLFAEAEEYYGKALKAAISSASAGDEAKCLLSLGTLAARRRDWATARELTEQVLVMSGRFAEPRLVLSAKNLLAACQLKDLDDERAPAVARSLLSELENVGYARAVAALRTNLGIRLYRTACFEEAVEELRQARQLAQDLTDDAVLRSSSAYLGRALFRLGRTAELDPDFVHAIQHHRDITAATDLIEGETDLDAQRLRTAGAHGAEILQTRGDATDQGAAFRERSAPSGRTISVSREVLRGTHGFDLAELTALLAESRLFCAVCGLIIASNGRAVVIAVRVVGSQQARVSVAHDSCQHAARVETRPAATSAAHHERADREYMEVECCWFGEQPAIVADCHGGWLLSHDGKIVDATLEALRRFGFTQPTVLRDTSGVVIGLELDDPPPDITGRLSGKSLAISAGRHKLPDLTDLSFASAWYASAREAGHLILLFGRNLSGSVGDDVSPLVRAAEAGRIAAALVPLEVITEPPRGFRTVGLLDSQSGKRGQVAGEAQAVLS